MVKRFIAIAPKGQEYFYRRSSMIAVPESSAFEIAQALTRERYQIKDGEVWHVYENDNYSNMYIQKQIKRNGTHKISIQMSYDDWR